MSQKKKNQCTAPSSPPSMYRLHSEFCVDISFGLSVYSSFSISYLQKSLHVPDLFSKHRAVLHVIVDPASMASGRLCRLLVDNDLRTKYTIYKQFIIISNYRIVQCETM